VVIQTRHRQTALWLGALALAALPFLGGCSFGRPETLAPANKLYEDGNRDLGRKRYEAAREQFRKIVERHPDSNLVPQARFLLGESYYRDGEWDKAAREFDGFMAIYPAHAIADLAQYRLARSYFDGMPDLERDQAVAARALAEFQKLLKYYPESRYAPDAIVKIDACRLRLAQKELWIADWYVRQSNWVGAIQRYDVILKDYGRTSAAAQALYQKADALLRLERGDEARSALQKLVDDFPQSEWARRARQRQTSELRPSS
jgi:outer membrane protein assembly factor BamD